MHLSESESLDQTIVNEPPAAEPWTTPQLETLPVEDTAAASPTDISDAGIFS